jgi:hypothetical protein
MMADSASAYGIRFIVLIRERDHRVERTIQRIARQSPQSLELREARNLHAKLVDVCGGAWGHGAVAGD